MASSFVHLHLHTQFSLLDGANQIEPLVQQIKSFNQPAVAMTDHGNMFGAIEFYRKAKDAGIKPIIGCEAYMAPGSRFAAKDSGLAHNDYYHLILLARNLAGYQNLINLVSKAYLEGFYYKPRMDKEILKAAPRGTDCPVRLLERRNPVPHWPEGHGWRHGCGWRVSGNLREGALLP